MNERKGKHRSDLEDGRAFLLNQVANWYAWI